MPVPTPLRAALLASWGSALLSGDADVDDVVGAVEGVDEPHLLVDGTLSEPEELGSWLDGLRGTEVVGLRLALPAPGDPLGLVGPPAANRAALGAGEAVVAVPGSAATEATMLVPDIRTFGPAGDQGHCVTWRCHQASAAWPDVPTLAQADRELGEQLRESTSTLAALGTTSWRTDGSAVAAHLRGAARSFVLPDSAGPRAETVAQRAVGVAPQRLDAGNVAGEHVGQTTGGIGEEATLLHDGDLPAGGETRQTAGAAEPRGGSPDDDDAAVLGCAQCFHLCRLRSGVCRPGAPATAPRSPRGW